MSKHISNFLATVCSQVKYKGVHGGISEELKSHIHELTDTYVNSGMSESEASQKAVEQMGDPIQIGQELNRTHKPKTEWSIIALLGAMVILGGMTLFSYANNHSPYLSPASLNVNGFFVSYIRYWLIGVVVCSLFYFFDYTKIEKYSLHIFIGTILFLFISKDSGSFGGVPVLYLRGLRLPTSTIALPLLLISFPGLITKWANGDIKNMFKLIGSMSLAALTLLVFTNAISIGVGLLATMGASITLAVLSRNFKGNKRTFLFSLYGSGVLGVSLAFTLILKPYQIARLLSIIDPTSHEYSYGYIVNLLRDMLSGSKLLGPSDNLYFDFNGDSIFLLPEAHTDFAFAYIVSAFGWLAGVLTIIIVILAIARMLFATRKIKHDYGKYLSTSIVSIFALQAIGNILMNLTLLPTLHVSLPFISYGGTNFVINMALIGLLLGVYRRKDMVLLSKKTLTLH